MYLPDAWHPATYSASTTVSSVSIGAGRERNQPCAAKAGEF